MSADFEAAFDSLSWDMLLEVLKQYNFEPNFRETIKFLYLNNENFSRIMLNGHLGNKIFLKCGIRQGDPASGYLFNLAVNLLANQMKKSNRVRGIKISDNEEVRISQYADDTILFIKNEEECIKGAIQEMKLFSAASGLKLNVDKTCSLRVGYADQSNIDTTSQAKFVDHLRILGITFNNDNKNITEVNFEPKLAQIQKEISHWRRRNITTLGRITVVKSLLLSKLVHLFMYLPDPSQKDLKRLESIFFIFVWGSKRDPVKRAKLIQSFTAGGLRMVDVRSFCTSMKLTWLKRLMTSNATWTHIVEGELPAIETVLQFGSKHLENLTKKVQNKFWSDVLKGFASFSRVYTPEETKVLYESVWFSDHTRYDGSIIRSWYNKGIRFINDLFNENTGSLHTKESLENAYDVKMTFLCYASLIRSLPNNIKNITIHKKFGPIIPLRMCAVLNEENFPRMAYAAIVAHRQLEIRDSNERQKGKWMRDIGCFEQSSLVNLKNVTGSTKLLMFQYKLQNRIIATNTYLKVINIKDEDICTFCKLEPETLVHLFWRCPKVKSYIADIKLRFLDKYAMRLTLDSKTWFFLMGASPKETYIITLAKMVIYEARMRDILPNVTHLINKLKIIVEIEQQVAKRKNKQTEFDKRWGQLKNINFQSDVYGTCTYST